MVEYLRKFENPSIKIARVNSIFITKSINLHIFTLILYGFRVSCDHMRFSLLSPFIVKSMFKRKPQEPAGVWSPMHAIQVNSGQI